MGEKRFSEVWGVVEGDRPVPAALASGDLGNQARVKELVEAALDFVLLERGAPPRRWPQC